MKLGELVDKLARITDIRKRAEEEEDNLKSELKKLDLDDGTYDSHSGKHILVVLTKVSKIIDAELVKEKLGPHKFMKVVNVVKKELEKYMLPADIDKCSAEGKGTKSYTTKEKK